MEEKINEMDLLLADKEIKINNKNIIVKKISLLNTIRLASKISGIVTNYLNINDKHVGLVASALTKIASGNEKENEKYAKELRIMGVTELVSLIDTDIIEILQEVIEKSTNLSGEEIEEIELEEGYDLLLTIYEVNKGFFQKLSKKLKVIKLPKKAEKKKK